MIFKHSEDLHPDPNSSARPKTSHLSSRTIPFALLKLPGGHCLIADGLFEA